MNDYCTVENPLLDYDQDPENCGACEHVADPCPYHRGMEDGRALFAEAIAALNADPELANGVVLAEHARSQAASRWE